VSFDVSADAYMRFMGQYSEPLARRFADLPGIRPEHRVLDVGCGPGALTAELVSRAAAVSAVEPSPSFAAAVRARLPEVDVRQCAAERLPFPDDTFDVAMRAVADSFVWIDGLGGVRFVGAGAGRAGGLVRPQGLVRRAGQAGCPGLPG
jgi:SAM-dependent methyltransferase